MSAPIKTNNQKFYNYLLVVVLICFAALKFNDLFLPYFWDELGVYSQCAVHQYHNGVSLMPASVPDYLSRGHPLLLTALNASVMKIFGPRVFVAHGFHLLISILLLWVVYFYTSRYFNRLTGFIAIALLAAQPLFIAQSILVFPEVILSLFIFLSIVNYYEKKYLLYALFASLAILTKESGIVVPAVVFCYSIFRWLIARSTADAFKPLNLILTFFPYLIFGIFLLVQKEQNGWYFFPYHINNTGFTFNECWIKFADFFHFVFHRQGRYWWKSILLIAAILALLRNQITVQSISKNILTPFLIFIVAFFLFSSLSFYMDRYVVVTLVFATILIAVSLVNIFQHRLLVMFGLAFLSAIALSHYESSETWRNDVDMGYRRHIQTLQQAIDFCSNQPGSNKKVYGNFPSYYAVNFKEGGYIKPTTQFTPVMNLENGSNYFIQTTPGDWTKPEDRFKDSLLAVFNDGYAESKVYYLTRK